MKMIETNVIKRTTSHILKYSNKEKLCYIDRLFKDYEVALKECIEQILNGKLPLKPLLTSSLLTFSTIEHARWKQVVYKQASEIVRSSVKKNKELRYKKYKKVYKYFKEKGRMLRFTSKKFSELTLKMRWYVKPVTENITINVDERFLNFQEGNSFDEFINLKLPYFIEGKRKSIQINLPIKHHKHSLKYKSWERAKTIQLLKKNKSYYINFIYKKELPIVKEAGDSIGIDVGYKKLITTSREEYIGGNLEELYEKIAKAERGSKNYRDLLKLRNNLIRKAINDLDISNVKTIFMEELKGLKANTFRKENKKTNRKFRNKSQYALYTKVYKLLKVKCEEQGVQIVKVSPAYTSQTCSRCKTVNEKNRKGELYSCKSCGLKIDADFNASINILNRGVYSPSDAEKLNL